MKKSYHSPKFSTLVEVLRWRALHQPEKLAFTYLVDGEKEEVNLTYKDIDRQARSVASMLQSTINESKCVLLLYPPGMEFVTAFLGCLYAGVVAVPAYPPRKKNSLLKLQGIARGAEITVALTTQSMIADIQRQVKSSKVLASLKLLSTDLLPDEMALLWQRPELNSNSLAYLQYTSGSTGKPKGVMVSHGNLLHNEQMLQDYFGNTDKTIQFSWLPMFHDMGLVSGLLQPLYVGFPGILMSPVAFIQKPLRWLQAISRYKVTTSGGPNFAFDLCVQKIMAEEKAQLDLSSWKSAFNGSEPVRAETLDRFYDAFASCGFREEAFCPCYGMAEATLIISGVTKTEVPIVREFDRVALEQNNVVTVSTEQSNSLKKVSCGEALSAQKVKIVDPDTCIPCPAGRVGEIWVQGPSVAQGYWKKPEKTKQDFHACLAGTKEGAYLRTGDLAFILEGEIFITGRLKDLIIIHGRNHYPQDIELTVEKSHPALQAGCGAAFSIDIEGTEKLVIVYEVQRKFIRKLNIDEVAQTIQQAVSEAHELQVYAVELVKPVSIPKTSSGKIQRHACKAGFLDESLAVVAKWMQNAGSKKQISENSQANAAALQKGRQKNSASQAIEVWLVTRIAKLLKVTSHEIDIREPFTWYGLDSVAAISLTGDLSMWLGKDLSPTLIYDYPNIEALAGHLADSKQPKKTISGSQKNHRNEPIAIIGMECRFPGARDCDSFWQLLHDGVDAVSSVPADRWNLSAGELMPARYGAFLSEIDQFDPHFFGISPREATSMDPQQRLLLEVSWEALENAGLAAKTLSGTQTGVFIGITGSDYSRMEFEGSVDVSSYAGTGNALSIAANRLSYILNLRGPSTAVDTACSSSLFAMHQACQSLRLGESDLALAGGVNLIIDPNISNIFSRAGMLAADGRCKAFSEYADGYVRGEGCGIIILKRFSEAIADGDNVLAIIRGSAVNQDGRSNGLTAPNGPAQQEVVRRALKNADVSPDWISYVETHGTGTSLGDPIEVNSLKDVLISERQVEQLCWIGSVKANIGHLEAAAGVAGVIKVVLAMQHKELPGQLYFRV